MKNQTNSAKKIWAAAMAAAVFCNIANAVSVSAAETMKVSKKEYNLSVEDLPEGVGQAYAKLHDADKKADAYMLSLFDGYDAMMAMEKALQASGENLSALEYQAVEATVYEMDEEGDYYPLDEMMGITLICPLPDPFAKNAEKVQVAAVDTKGNLYRIPSKTVRVDGKDCVMFDLSVFTTYAFVYKSSGAFTSGKLPTPTPEPTRKVEKTPTPEPTRKAEKTPTPEPTRKAEKTPMPEPTRKAEKTPTLEPTRKAEKTPTPTAKPAKAGTTVSKDKGESASSSRDKTPQTGDTYDAKAYVSMLAAGGVLVCFGMLCGKKRK